jgi:hypothetical protein
LWGFITVQALRGFTPGTAQVKKIPRNYGDAAKNVAAC